MTPSILEQRILDLAKREPGARAARVNVGADVVERSHTWADEHWHQVCFIPTSTRTQIVYKLRAQGLLRPHDPKRPGLYLP